MGSSAENEKLPLFRETPLRHFTNQLEQDKIITKNKIE